MKRFIKEPGHADTYHDLDINFIKGHNPDLVIFGDDGEEVERIRLNEFTTDEIHSLVQEKGFTKMTEAQKDAKISADAASGLGASEGAPKPLKPPNTMPTEAMEAVKAAQLQAEAAMAEHKATHASIREMDL